jgi:hypothetical protein
LLHCCWSTKQVSTASFLVKMEGNVWCISYYMLGPCVLCVCRTQGNWWTTWRKKLQSYVTNIKIQLWMSSVMTYENIQLLEAHTTQPHIACFPHMSALYLFCIFSLKKDYSTLSYFLYYYYDQWT